MNLFDLIEPPPPRVAGAPPPELPDISAFSEVYLNFETTGLKWWGGDLPVGMGLGTPDGRYQYYPFAHQGGGNLDEPTVYRWCQRSLPGKRITNINTRFEVHMARVWGEKLGGGGLDFEAMGCKVSDVAHYAALLDDWRFKFNLDGLIEDFLEAVRVPRVDERRMGTYHAGEVAARAAYQVEAVHRLKEKLWPMLDAQGLQRVRALEDQVIYVVCEMEKNGTPLDVELLDKWVLQSAQELNNLYMELYRETGLKINPDQASTMVNLFRHLGLPIARTAPTLKKPHGSPSFAAPILKQHATHPTIAKVIRISKLTDLRSKYLLPYSQRVDRSTGILRYALHQLRSQKDPNSEDSRGTVSGRFSSTQLTEGVGVNIQQVMKTAKQRVSFGYDEDDDSHDDEIYPIRRLHIPASGQFLSADAMQIEYRMFATYTGSPHLINPYFEEPAQDEKGNWIKGPMLTFHRLTHQMLKPRKPDLTYRRGKDYNFANVYGAGLRKKALMLEFISDAQFRALNNDDNWYKSPLLDPIKEIQAIYDELIPEVKTLLDKVKHVAMPECGRFCKSIANGKDYDDKLHRTLEHRGYVMTLLGRRSRFPNGQRSHKGLNCVIQGGAADIHKQKLVELHAAREYTGFLLRFPAHDEFDGDIPDEYHARLVEEILDHQSFPELKVPILHEIGIGPNWKDLHDLESHYGRVRDDQFGSSDSVRARFGYEGTGKDGGARRG